MKWASSNGHAASFKTSRNLGMPLGITLNGVNGTLGALYKATGANLSQWNPVVGIVLPIGGAGADPTLNVVSGLSNPDTAVATTFDAGVGGKYYSAPDGSFLNDDGASDYVTEVVFNTRTSTGTEDTLFAKYLVSDGVLTGFLFLRSPVGAVASYGRLQTVANLGLSDNTWYHIFYVSRRDGNVRCYVNGALTSNQPVGGMAGNTSPFQFNAYETTHVSPGPMSLAYFASWSGVNLAAGATAEMDALALSRKTLAGL